MDDTCELVIIDGDSKDGTQDIISKYSPFVAYTVSEKDNGVYDAWNKALKKVSGQWIAFIGSDDILNESSVTSYKEHLILLDNSYNLVCAKIDLVNQEGNFIRTKGEPWNWKKMANRTWPMAHPGMLHNKSLFDLFGLFDTKFQICGDSEFLVRCGTQIKADFINKSLVTMQIGGISSNLSMRHKALIEGYYARKKHHVRPFYNFWYQQWALFKYHIKTLLDRTGITA